MESEGFKAGFVALVGRPSVGKSTLLNALLKTSLSIVSPKPQTTRHKLLGILNGDGFQACFLDTPGLVEKPRDLLQRSLGKAALSAARDDADLVLLLVGAGVPSAQELADLSSLVPPGVPLVVALNKADLLAKPSDADAALAAYREALKPAATLTLSALKGTGVEELKREILARLPASPPFYEGAALSDRWERFFAAEIVRGEVFRLYSDEVPHATAVQIEEFREGRARDSIRAVLFVERDSQKGILIGQKGKALKDLRDRSRAAIEKFLGRPVELEFWIKVRKDWRKDPRSLKEFGYL